MQMEKPTESHGCRGRHGNLPGPCGIMAFPYIAKQSSDPERYSRNDALQNGTLFPGLDLPFKEAIQAKQQIQNTPLAELMALDFAVDELGLYLTTHSDDQEVLDLYWTYIQLAKEGRKKYEKLYGPLLQTDIPADRSYSWLKDPWPWDEGRCD